MALGFLAKGLLGAGKVVGKGVGLAGRGALMAGRAGMALRGRRRKINPTKLMGREDNDGGGKNVEKGGALMILPSGDIVAYSKGDISTESRKPNEDVVYTIHKKVIEIDKFLKGTVAAEKIEQKKEKQKKEKERRAEKEEKLEKPDKGDEDKETPKPLIPQIGFLEGIKQWITKVLVGWLVFNLIKFLPKIMGVLKWIGKIADFVFWLGGKFLDALVTMVHWGYKAFEWTRGAIGNVFGETGLKVFDGITGVLKNVLNLSMSLALAMIALSNEFGTNLLDYAKGFGGIFKHGLARAFPRLLIKLFGKKGAAAILTKIGVAKAGAVATLTKAAAATGTAITGTAKVVGGALTGLPAAFGLLASGLGEGAFQITKMGQGWIDHWRKEYESKKWYDPRKPIDWAILQVMRASNMVLGNVGVLLDIIGTPFRYLIELVRYPFLSEKGKRKQRENLAKFDARIREQFRKIMNVMTLGLAFKEEGQFGSIYGKQGTDAMGYTKDGKTKSQQSDIEKTEKTFEVKDGKVIGGTGTQKDYDKLKKIQRLEDEADFAAEQGDWKKYEQIQKQISILEGEKEVVETKQEVSKKPQGLWRGITGAADFLTGGMFDFDQQNRKGAPKDYGIRRIAGGLADWATMGLTDFDKRGKGNLQFDPIGGGKDKAWGSRNEQAKRREKQSGFGLKRGIGGALDFATFGMFDFDKQNRKGAPKGFGIKRIAGGLADFVTGGTTDFDKRGSGLLQYSGFTGRRGMQRPMRSEYHQRKIDDLQSRFNQIPMETTVNPDGSITSRGSGRLLAGELFRPGQPLTQRQYSVVKMSMRMGNTYPDEVMKSYTLYETEQKRVKGNANKGNANNIMPLDVNSVSKKINNVSSSASYEDGAEQRIVIPSTSQEQSVDGNQSTGKLVPVAVGGGGGSSEIADALYMGG